MPLYCYNIIIIIVIIIIIIIIIVTNVIILEFLPAQFVHSGAPSFFNTN